MKNEIGTDPTMVDVIETLDVPEPIKKIEPKKVSQPNNNNNGNNNNNNNSSKNGSFIKNLLFIILILALMGGIAFGVYYYLKLAKNNNPVEVAPAFNINKMEIKAGDEIPESLNDYGDFSKIDVSNCTLDTSEVKNDTPGNYTYYVICGGSKYSESFVVKSKDGNDADEEEPVVTKRLNVTTYFNYTIKGEQLNIERLISSDDELTFSFVDKEKYKEDMYNIGLQKVGIKAVDSENNENIYYAYIYVINEEPKMKFKCVSSDNSLIDEIIFNKNKENMNNSIRMYEYTYDETEYSNVIETINDGIIKINENEGNAILDYQNKKITILKELSKETLDSEYGSEFPSTYGEISDYYRNNLKYTCSFV